MLTLIGDTICPMETLVKQRQVYPHVGLEKLYLKNKEIIDSE